MSYKKRLQSLSSNLGNQPSDGAHFHKNIHPNPFGQEYVKSAKRQPLSRRKLITKMGVHFCVCGANKFWGVVVVQ